LRIERGEAARESDGSGRIVEEMGDGSPYFILDGHHKLMAYLALNIHPPVALITQLVKT
jgi:hypothetical protein